MTETPSQRALLPRDDFKQWWNGICRLGDPIRRPNLAEDAFFAGYAAAIAAWNTRSTPIAGDEVIERVARAMFDHEWANVAQHHRPDFGGDDREYWLASARAAIEAIGAPVEQERDWQPIETAPPLTHVLVFIPRADRPENLPVGQAVVAYKTDHGTPFRDDWRYAHGTARGMHAGWPTHWRPLPTPPKATP